MLLPEAQDNVPALQSAMDSDEGLQAKKTVKRPRYQLSTDSAALQNGVCTEARDER